MVGLGDHTIFEGGAGQRRFLRDKMTDPNVVAVYCTVRKIAEPVDKGGFLRVFNNRASVTGGLTDIFLMYGWL